MVTKYWEVHDNLKFLLDNPHKIKYYAYNNYTYEAIGLHLKTIFKENNFI